MELFAFFILRNIYEKRSSLPSLIFPTLAQKFSSKMFPPFLVMKRVLNHNVLRFTATFTLLTIFLMTYQLFIAVKRPFDPSGRKKCRRILIAEL